MPGAVHAFADLGPLALAGLALCGLVGGVGITALGPGGVLVTIGLYALSGLRPEAVAGTAIATHVGTGALGTATYLRSGHLAGPSTRRTAGILVTAALIGTPVGVWINSCVSHDGFGALLGGCVVVAGVLVLWRDRRESRPPAATMRGDVPVIAAVGAAVAAAGGLFGIGGPLLAVPLLVVLDMPILAALGAAQAQSIVIAGVGTITYVAQGAISWPLLLVVGVPELAGVVIGARVARAAPTHRLRLALVAALLACGVVLVVQSA
ncbi:MAG TPA: sulfite exporter TauE/SafE family protein [Baekduia sp.]|nr:sulfite exporter TauE/SafE family protein [Baekduia sp.]